MLMQEQELKELKKSHTNILRVQQDNDGVWNVGSYTNKDYDLSLLHATRLASKQYNHDCIIVMEYFNGYYRKYSSDGELLNEYYNNTGDGVNDYKVDEIVTGCPVSETPCYFPFCTNNLSCNFMPTNVVIEDNDNVDEIITSPVNGELVEPVKEEKEVEKVGCMTSVKQYFNYQEELTLVRRKLDDIIYEQKELGKEIKTDIRTVFTAYDIPNLTYDVELTGKGIRIKMYSKKYNNDELITPINTDLLLKLNKLIGMDALLNIQSERKVAGNHVHVLELIYELE
ncbi:MAG: hypothetical protein IJH63_00250 [Methanobrevibacter sp.]|nr:hypothetical protein [Methanosphaera sp.]MBR0369134.1 hypothetical protein [Methanobrevibacter sp.]